MSKVTATVRMVERGFTRLELVLVFAHVVFGIGVVAVYAAQTYGGGGYLYSARSQVGMLSDAVTIYASEIGTCPTDKQGLDALLVAPSDLPDSSKWKGPYIDRVQLPVDPWNHPYQYKALSGKDFRIWSHGPDGIGGSKDDITMQL